MSFARQEMLFLLLGLPGLVALLVWGVRRRKALLRRFASEAVLPYLAPSHSPGRQWLKVVLLTAAAACVIFAAARPQWGYEERKIVSRGIDILVAVDTSNSMMAPATADRNGPTRMDRAKELLQSVLWKARGDRVGVMAFAATAVIQCPLTLDYGMAKTALQSLGTGSVPSQGTAIGGAIDAAVKAFETAGTGERILVLLTDGEDTGSDPIEAATRAAAAKVRVYTIGIGTTQGMPIPLPGGGYKQDTRGNVVSSKLDFDTLRKVAQLASGQAIKANQQGDAELDVILKDIDAIQKEQKQDQVFQVPIERFQWFLLPAILLLAWEALETGATRRVRAWKGRMSRS